MKFKELTLFLVLSAIITSGCMRFTQHDYDLQQNAYEKARQQEAQRDQERLQMRW